MTHNFSKQLKRELRTLNELAWERELNTALRKLGENFAAMEEGNLSPFELSELIHEFHNGEGRDLYKRYVFGYNSFAVADAIVRGIIPEPEVSEKLLAELQATIENIKSMTVKDTDT